ncbi:MAG: hypothetical protein HY051_04215 [Candidatus Aenigmarchaeota archaeon]|nr:hypothetical protein [Candidatus Aenigmarchaeota archaeon]
MQVVEFFTSCWGEYCDSAKAEVLKAIKEKEDGKDIQFVELDIDKKENFLSLVKYLHKVENPEPTDDPIIPVTVVNGKNLVIGYSENMKEVIKQFLE